MECTQKCSSSNRIAIGAIMGYDFAIGGGAVVDGTGAPARRADVAVTGERIVEVGECAGEVSETIDATGRRVTPGCVDIPPTSTRRWRRTRLVRFRVGMGSPPRLWETAVSPLPRVSHRIAKCWPR
jgi:hypothetical protein